MLGRPEPNRLQRKPAIDRRRESGSGRASFSAAKLPPRHILVLIRSDRQLLLSLALPVSHELCNLHKIHYIRHIKALAHPDLAFGARSLGEPLRNALEWNRYSIRLRIFESKALLSTSYINGNESSPFPVFFSVAGGLFGCSSYRGIDRLSPGSAASRVGTLVYGQVP